jgi:hypothetical protein
VSLVRLFLLWFCYPLSADLGDYLSPVSFTGQSTLCKQGLLLQGRCTDIWPLDLPPSRRWRPKTGPFLEAVLLWPVTEVVNFSSPHSHLCRLLSAVSQNQDGSRGSWGKSLPGPVDTSPLAGKVARGLEPENGAASEALWLSPDPEAVSLQCYFLMIIG